MFKGPKSAGEVELRFGYTIAELEGICRKAVIQYWGREPSLADRFAIAWSAMVEHLYACPAPPRPRDLVTVTWRALSHQRDCERSTHGLSGKDPNRPTPRFCRYWSHGPATGIEEQVVERLALAQIWPRLSPEPRRALGALAVHDDGDLAAASLGLTRAAFRKAIAQAREEFLALWHEGEQPSRVWAVSYGGRKGRGESLSQLLKRRRRAALAKLTRDATGSS